VHKADVALTTLSNSAPSFDIYNNVSINLRMMMSVE
jgi:hypothetical protein